MLVILLTSIRKSPAVCRAKFTKEEDNSCYIASIFWEQKKQERAFVLLVQMKKIKKNQPIKLCTKRIYFHHVLVVPQIRTSEQLNMS